MSGIQAKFSAVVARAPRQQTSRTGIEWTRIQCDIPIRKEDGTEFAYWCNVSVPGAAGAQYMHFQVGDRIYAEGNLILNSYERAGQLVIGITLLAKRISLLEHAPVTDEPRTTADTRTRAGVMANAEPNYRSHDDAPSSRQLRRENGTDVAVAGSMIFAIGRANACRPQWRLEALRLHLCARARMAAGPGARDRRPKQRGRSPAACVPPSPNSGQPAFRHG